MTEAYLIEDGEITVPLRGANLIGNGPSALRDIDAVGNDFAMGWHRARAARTARASRRRRRQPTLRVPPANRRDGSVTRRTCPSQPARSGRFERTEW